ncbi:hypothetical protein [Streptomyces sp. NPDC056304]|uniref:hypothetical protein n=1 Tax=Streptomyces sp. NPDC056304 TaxID=3345778 RepID=UPI0035E10B03
MSSSSVTRRSAPATTRPSRRPAAVSNAERSADAAAGSGRSDIADMVASIHSGPGGSALGGGSTSGAGAPSGSATRILSSPSTGPGPGPATASRSTATAARSEIHAPSAGPPSGISRPGPSRRRTAAVHPSALSGLSAVVICPACRIHDAVRGKRT